MPSSADSGSGRFTDRFGPATVLLGPDVTITGDLTGSGSVHLEGTIDGSVSVDGLVVVGQRGSVVGRIEAAAAVVNGQVDGEVRVSGSLELGQSCRVAADLAAASVAMADGATFDGSITMNGNDPAAAPLTYDEKRGG
jgi:cytoskeletal protein CcmA (bactofilin family)